MKGDSFIKFAVDGAKVLFRGGLRGLADPVSLFREYIWVEVYKDVHSFVNSLDYSYADVQKNKELMEGFSNLKNVDVKSINWFAPYFEESFGGVYTILRFANYFQAKKGIKNRFIAYGRPSGSELELRKRIVKLFPALAQAEIIILRNTDVGTLPYADISIATQWQSAYLLLKFNNTKGKFYFIQDYEPMLYPASTIYALAEATYRFGFYGIANTPGLYDIYTREYKGTAEYFIPSVDREIFYPSKREALKPSVERPFTIFFYGRPGVSRNAFELGNTALEKIKKKHGEQVRVYAAGSPKWDARTYNLRGIIDNLGLLPYEETGELYRRCDLGVVFMFTKHPSYLPFELMASGCVVLSNYNAANTWLLKDGFNCVLSEPSVLLICEKIEMIMSNPELRKQLASNAIQSLANISWEGEMEKIHRFICRK